jgi:hypothetical protein
MGGSLLEGLSDMDPIPELVTGNADIELYFLSANGIGFSAPTHDPWYRATRYWKTRKVPTSFDNATAMNDTAVYLQDEPASPLGCKVQHQICNPSQPEESRCGPLTSSADHVSAAFSMGTIFPGEDEATGRIDWAYNAAFGVMGYVEYVVSQLGAHSLLARLRLSLDGLQGPIPDDQWMSDVEHWHNIAMTSYQGSLIVSALGPADPAMSRFYSRKPNNTEQSDFCNNQVRATSTTCWN